MPSGAERYKVSLYFFQIFFVRDDGCFFRMQVWKYNLFRVFFDFEIGAGVVEELIFREFLFKNFKFKFGKISAIFIISIIFAVLHITNQQENIGALLIEIYSFVLSIYLCLLYRTNSVWVCAIVHGV